MKKELITINNMRNMSIDEIDNYGSDIQEKMKDTSNNILAKTDMVSTGSIKQELNEMYDISTKHKKLMVPIIGKPLQKIRSLTTNYTKIQNRLDSIELNMSAQKDRIDEYIGYMIEQTESLDSIVSRLRTCEKNLTEYSQELESETVVDNARIQAVASRLRSINATRIMAEQAHAEALMIMTEQREAKRQLDSVIRNAIPALQMQVVNTVGIRVNKETQEIISKTRDIMGNIVVQNATEVKNMAEQLQSNRTKSMIDDDKLLEAQRILEDTLKFVTEASKLEAKNNMRIVTELQDKAQSNAEYIDMLKNKIGDSNKIASI